MATIVFDWDGVLLDSFDFYYDLNRAAMAGGGAVLSVDDYRAMFGGNIHASFKARLSAPEQYQQFLVYKAEHFAAGYQHCRFFPALAGLIRQLGKKHTLAICSSTEKHFIVEHLTAARLADYFVLVSGDQATSKAAALQAILAAAPAGHPPAIMVTDTSGDVAAAKALGLRTIAVGWGFQHRPVLLAAAPDHYVSHPAQLKSLLL